MAQAALQAGAQGQCAGHHHHVHLCHGAHLLPLGPDIKDPAAGAQTLYHVCILCHCFLQVCTTVFMSGFSLLLMLHHCASLNLVQAGDARILMLKLEGSLDWEVSYN